MSNLLQTLIQRKHILLADGATGSNLFQMGLQTGEAPELWNTEHPERIAAHYRSFVEAGSDIILSNTFGGTRYRLKLHHAEDRVEELNVEAVRLLRQEIEKSGREIVAAGSMGPTGEILAPLGDLSHDKAVAAFREQAEALKKGGVDVFWIETMSSKDEANAAVEACSGLGLPIVTTYSIDTNGRTMMGLSPADIVDNAQHSDTPLFALGSNCGTGTAELVAAVVNIKNAMGDAEQPLIVAKANCGIPQYVDGEIVYGGSAETMAEYARMAIDAGATIIGGCCGTLPEHVAAMRQAIDEHQRDNPPTREQIEEKLGPLSTGAVAQLEGRLSVEEGSASQGPGRRRTRRR
jgi:5-methyltetrahydrofolate--homocysteine methyltransferase